jgi:hypothetical protein
MAQAAHWPLGCRKEIFHAPKGLDSGRVGAGLIWLYRCNLRKQWEKPTLRFRLS